MSIKIRLARRGAKKRPFYHIVSADSRMPRDGRYVEKLGYYNPMLPRENKERIVLKEDRIKYWLDQGAQVTDRVARFLGEKGIMPKYQHNDTPKRSQPKTKAQERLKEQEGKLLTAQKAQTEAEAQIKIMSAQDEKAKKEIAKGKTISDNDSDNSNAAAVNNSDDNASTVPKVATNDVVNDKASDKQEEVKK